MTEEEINKYLTEQLGECWHEWYVTEDASPFRKYACDKCDIERINPKDNPNFFTWQGMGKLREFYDTWDEEKKLSFRLYAFFEKPDGVMSYDYVWHKDNTANLMYGFLKERNGSNS